MNLPSKLFVDTSGWCAVFDRRDQNHKRASEFFAALKGKPVRLITSDDIFDESVTLLRARIGHSSAVAFGESVLRGNVVMEEINESLRKEAWELFVKYKEQAFSFTDCTSFVLMRNLKLQDAFAFAATFGRWALYAIPSLDRFPQLSSQLFF